MTLSEWYGNCFDILRAPTVPFGYLHFLYARMDEEYKDKQLREQRQAQNTANAMNGSRGRRVM